MATTPVAYVDATGIHVPTYTDVLAYLVAQYRGIYGSDVVLDPDTQDGQWIGIIALAITDANSMSEAVYNAFSPATAQGAGLSSVVKINGIARKSPTNSSVDLLLGGTAGTVLNGCYATDADSNQWIIPDGTTIPVTGQITVTATAAQAGTITAPAGSISTIGTPTSGWHQVTNPAAAVAGAPVETDAALRKRQVISTMQPSVTIGQGIEGAIADLPGVTVVKLYDNDSRVTDVNGIPGNSIAVVVEGGDDFSIASTIAVKKGPGCGTYGNTSEVVIDAVSGIPKTISFWRAVDVLIDVVVSLKALPGYTSNIGDLLKQAIVDHFATLTPGDDVYLSKLYGPANLSNAAASATFNITSIKIARHLLSPAQADVAVAFNERATTGIGNVYLVVT